MKAEKLFLLLWLGLISCMLVAQNGSVGIGTVQPDGSAILDLVSGKQGLAVPQVNLMELNNDTAPIRHPKTGLLIFNAGDRQETGFYYWDGQRWVQLAERRLPIVVTGDINNIATTTATVGGQVVDDGGQNVYARGVCYSINPNPTIDNDTTCNGTGLGTFTAALTDLQPATTYHVRAYARNYSGTAYGEDRTFTTTTIGISDDFVFKVNNTVYTMKAVKGGTFWMGTSDQEGEQNHDPYSQDDEHPVHQVTLSNFWMAEIEVTQKLWLDITGRSIQNQRDLKGTSEQLYGTGDTYPIYYVCWNEICDPDTGFLVKLNTLLADTLDGKRFVLPTEAQWEYAARGGQDSHNYLYAGSNNANDVAWHNDNNNNANSGNKTHPVKSKNANELNLYDMSGNVWEWCSDWDGDYTSDEQTNPQGPPTNTDFKRIERGGAFSSGNVVHCRVAFRSSDKQTSRFRYLGFRLALVP